MTSSANEKLADEIEGASVVQIYWREPGIIDDRELSNAEQDLIVSALRQPAGVSEGEIKRLITQAMAWHPTETGPSYHETRDGIMKAVLALLNRPQTGEVDAPLKPPHDDRLASPDMTPEQIRQWIGACNHEPARRVLRTYLVMLESGFMKDCALSGGK